MKGGKTHSTHKSDTSTRISDIGSGEFSNTDVRTMEIKLAAVLKREFEKRGWTQAKVAKDLGISPSLLGDWVSSRRLPSSKQFPIIHRLSHYLGLSLEELIFDINPRTKSVLFSSQFSDEGREYTLLIERTDSK